eukprot:jgi/Bigna1/87939/estExt_fgenesh1_pg.C_260048
MEIQEIMEIQVDASLTRKERGAEKKLSMASKPGYPASREEQERAIPPKRIVRANIDGPRFKNKRSLPSSTASCPFCSHHHSRVFTCQECIRSRMRPFKQKLSSSTKKHDRLRSQLVDLLAKLKGSNIDYPTLQNRLRATLDSSIAHELQQMEEEKEEFRFRKACYNKARESLRLKKEKLRKMKKNIDAKILIEREKLAENWNTKIEQLLQFYPIRTKDQDSCSIIGIPLVDKAHLLELTTSNEKRVSTALGYTVHITKMIAKYLCIPLPYEMVFHGSSSYIIDKGRLKRRFYFSKKEEFRTALGLLDISITDLCRKACVAEDQISRYRFLPNILKLIELVSLRRVFQPQPPTNFADKVMDQDVEDHSQKRQQHRTAATKVDPSTNNRRTARDSKHNPHERTGSSHTPSMDSKHNMCHPNESGFPTVIETEDSGEWNLVDIT